MATAVTFSPVTRARTLRACLQSAAEEFHAAPSQPTHAPHAHYSTTVTSTTSFVPLPMRPSAGTSSAGFSVGVNAALGVGGVGGVGG
eukprot:CAMPEP_0197588638 /NCGR_PEP_ID=MMETSP1326-20131121/9851_1 /TAXON_ID=1155430 /ORGANISM="Genus nov. species nov., Strain RCC2288" /LENGTH=86 /DNA_ID=CAMNT_0043153485 /DNA_START=272 /DNA_END=528 /DNA_ORIENTATION=-